MKVNKIDGITTGTLNNTGASILPRNASEDELQLEKRVKKLEGIVSELERKVEEKLETESEEPTE